MVKNPLFPFSDLLCDAMQRSLVSLIMNPACLFLLPTLTDRTWDLICNNEEERERLEFLGDALVGASVSEELFRCRPHEGPGFYTKARNVLTANSTFAHIMHKLGFHDINDAVKPAGDAFETILAAYHGERGPEAFQEYIHQYFPQLIHNIGHAYDHYRSTVVISRVKRKKLTNSVVMNRAQKLKEPKHHLNKKHRPPPGPSQHTLKSTASQGVIDLTGDNSDYSEDEVELTLTPMPNHDQGNSSPGSSKQASSTKLDPAIHGTPRKPPDKGKIESQGILRAISASPRVVRSSQAATSLTVRTSSTRNVSTDVQSDLADRLQRTAICSASGSGSADNPIILD
ncbi:unnamed protein product [Cyclocybe aegerita]|uniref:RNase III domain-containing protein n=1 Tax=Cyclocybe aegerita TaxID=1973307 RepID=A0A8S0VST7_CYCAE|nr:unnamed protein product [Cyclocybe aegerita]